VRPACTGFPATGLGLIRKNSRRVVSSNPRAGRRNCRHRRHCSEAVLDVAIEALGTQDTFENALRALRAGGTLSSLGVYSGKLSVPLEAFAAGLGDHKIVTTLCPGGEERMRRLMELVRHGRLDLTPLLTHTFPLDRITEAYKLFGERREGVIKVAIKL
jgi:alcohol dehydrogenase